MNLLDDLCEFIVDCEHKTAPIQDEGIPSIRTLNIGRGYFIIDGVNRVSEATYDSWTRRAVPEAGDLILAREAPVGNVAVIPTELKCCLGQRTVLMRPKEKDVDSDYLCYLLLTPALQADLLGKSGGATVHHLNLKDIRALPIPQLPTLDDQKAKASIIRAYDDLIETNRRRIALFEESARLLYREWFVNLRFPGYPVADRHRELPQGWGIHPLGEVVTVNGVSLGSHDKPEEIRYIDIASVETGIVLGATKMPYADAPGRARRKVQHGDVIWSCVRPNRRSYALLWQPHADILVSTGFAVLTAYDVPFSYLYFATTSDEFVAYLTNRATGAAYPAVKAKDFEEAPLLCPSPEVLQGFHEVCLPVLELRSTLISQNAKLTEARNALLPKLMSGEIQV